MSEIYSVARVAEIVGKTPQSVRAWCRNQEIERSGRKYLITQEVLVRICEHYHVELEKLSESERENNSSSESKKENLEVESLLIQLLREQLEAKDRQIAELEETNKTMAKSIAELTETNRELASSTKALSANAAMTTAAEKKDLLLVPSNAVVQEEEQRTDLVIVPKSEITHIEPEERPKLTRWERLKRAWKGEPWT